ncbi:hypothetical protein D3C76_697910 [compost metagenome]
MFQFQFRAFDPRKIQNVIDDLEQMLGGFRGQRGIFDLFLGHLGGFQQLQHAQHAIHRCAQFVAHHGKEI